MAKRFVAIWFRYLKTDWFTRRIPALHKLAFVLTAPDHGRDIVIDRNATAEQLGIYPGMAFADARAIFPSVHKMDDKPDHANQILKGLAEWCIRYTPCVVIDMPDGLILDASGCTHLWAGEENYLANIQKRLAGFGYDIRIAIADTIGAAWAVSRFGQNGAIVKNGEQYSALLNLPAASLRLNPATNERLHKLGLRQVKDFVNMKRSALQRRFGQEIITRIDQAMGTTEETLMPIQPAEPFESRLPCLEPIVTRTGIEIALQTLLDDLCKKLTAEGKGLRGSIFKGFRVDGKVECIGIGTNRATHNATHLFKLFEIKLDSIEPALGIEYFLLEAKQVEDVSPVQEKLWERSSGLHNTHLLELLDRFAGKFSPDNIHRYLPDEHYWPERSLKPAASITEAPTTTWNAGRPRPTQLLAQPQTIDVTAPIPDYPPMNFRYKGKLHKIIKADGPERIEQEWWLQQGEHRDYYAVEDEEGQRFWVFRSGHYDAEKLPGWFLHGFFA
jgi:protein ImuB